MPFVDTGFRIGITIVKIISAMKPNKNTRNLNLRSFKKSLI